MKIISPLFACLCFSSTAVRIVQLWSSYYVFWVFLKTLLPCLNSDPCLWLFLQLSISLLWEFQGFDLFYLKNIALDFIKMISYCSDLIMWGWRLYADVVTLQDCCLLSMYGQYSLFRNSWMLSFCGCTIIALWVNVSSIFKCRIKLVQVVMISSGDSIISGCILCCTFKSRFSPRHQKNFLAIDLCVSSFLNH